MRGAANSTLEPASTEHLRVQERVVVGRNLAIGLHSMWSKYELQHARNEALGVPFLPWRTVDVQYRLQGRGKRLVHACTLQNVCVSVPGIGQVRELAWWSPVSQKGLPEVG